MFQLKPQMDRQFQDGKRYMWGLLTHAGSSSTGRVYVGGKVRLLKLLTPFMFPMLKTPMTRIHYRPVLRKNISLGMANLSSGRSSFVRVDSSVNCVGVAVIFPSFSTSQLAETFKYFLYGDAYLRANKHRPGKVLGVIP